MREIRNDQVRDVRETARPPASRPAAKSPSPGRPRAPASARSGNFGCAGSGSPCGYAGSGFGQSRQVASGVKLALRRQRFVDRERREQIRTVLARSSRCRARTAGGASAGESSRS